MIISVVFVKYGKKGWVSFDLSWSSVWFLQTDDKNDLWKIK